MANFIALTPPLGQQPWGPVHLLAPVAAHNQLLALNVAILAVPVPANVSLTDYSYPPLNSYFRALILSKYPGTIFPDPELQDVFPCPDPDPIHIQEIWTKYDDALDDSQTTVTNLPGLLERELSVWIAEFDTSQRLVTIAIVSTDLMQVNMAKSKKRARRDTFEDDVSTEKKMHAPKKSKTGKKSSKVKTPKQSPVPVPISITTKKSPYEAAFPSDTIVDRAMPVYIMAKNYIENYAKSNEKYAERVRQVIAKQGLEHLAQRCAQFFAWGLKMPIRSAVSLNATAPAIPTISAETIESEVPATATPIQTASTQTVESKVTTTATPIQTASASTIESEVAAPATPIQSTCAPTIEPELTATATSIPTAQATTGIADSENLDTHANIAPVSQTGEVFEHWEYHADAKMREHEKGPDSEAFPNYVEPAPTEYNAIMEDIYNYGADGSVGEISEEEEEEEEEVINVVPLNMKPSFRFEPSSIGSRLPGFLEDLKAANVKLADDVRSGGLKDYNLELSEEDEGEYIEMNLGLGVLEEHGTSEEEEEAEKTVLIQEV